MPHIKRTRTARSAPPVARGGSAGRGPEDEPRRSAEWARRDRLDGAERRAPVR